MLRISVTAPPKRLRLIHTAIVSILTMVPIAAQADFSVSKKATKNVSCSGGVCTATAKQASLNTDELTSMLASGDVTVKTGGGAVTIQVLDGFSWTSTHRLTLDANKTVGFHQPVIVAGPGAVTISYNDGGTDGDLKFFPGGTLDFWDLNSSLVINGNTYELKKDLRTLGNSVARHPSHHYALVKDYDATDDGTYSSSPVQTHIKGTFEGLGHTIANLSIHSPFDRCVGLISHVAETGAVRDVIVSGITIRPSRHRYARLGAVAGCNDGVIANSSAQGTMSGWWVGGLVGYNEGLITDCAASATVTGKFAGGLVGISDGTILRSHASGRVHGQFLRRRVNIVLFAGGLAGVAYAISQSYATGPVMVDNGYFVNPRQYSGAGGLIGHALGPISDSYASGAVTGGAYDTIGGLVGRDDAPTIRSSYGVGLVSGATDGSSYDGGVAGWVDAGNSFAATYWDLDTSGRDQACG